MMQSTSSDPELVRQAVNFVLDGKVSAAARLLRAHLRKHPNDIEALHEIAFVLERQKKDEQAFECNQRILALAPDYIPALIDTANYWLYKKKDAEQALALVRKAEELLEAEPVPVSEDDQFLYQDLKESCYRSAWRGLTLLGRHEQALDVARQYESVDYLGAVTYISDSLIALNRFDEAEKLDCDGLFGPDLIMQGIARTLADAGRYEEALSYFLRSLSFARLPQQSGYLTGYIECLLLAKRYEQAHVTTRYWLTEKFLRPRLSSPVRRYLELLDALAEDGLSGDEVFVRAGRAVSALLDRICRSPSAKRCVRAVITCPPAMYDLYDTFEQMVQEYYRSRK